MRLRLAPPPAGEELLRRTPHEVVRDFPEALAVFRTHGLSFPAVGGRSLARLCEGSEVDDGRRLVADLRGALEWRAEG